MTETIDPDGAMASWVSPNLANSGHDVLPLPTQELAPLLGADGLGAFILAVAHEWRPDLVILCPPYDHIGRRTLRGLVELGVMPVAFAFDEPLFIAVRGAPEVWADYAHIFVTAPEAAERLSQQGLRASWLRWAASPVTFEQRSAKDTFEGRVLLVGRPYARRVELVSELERRGVPMSVRGHGWNAYAGLLGSVDIGGSLSASAMHAALRGAGAVVTTGDWEDEPVAMVKYRLLEAALCEARQVAQYSPDLRAYFSQDEVLHYDGVEDLAAMLQEILSNPVPAADRATRAYQRALAEHTWQTRFTELLSSIGCAPTPSNPGPAPSAYIVGLSLIAHDAERRGAFALAREAFRRWALLTDDPTPEAGLARISFTEARPTDTADHATRALTRHAADPRNAVGLYATLPTLVGTGLGAVGYLDPRPELLALEFSARVALDPSSSNDLVARLRSTPDLLVATAAILVPTYAPREASAWRHLFEAALAAVPTGHAHLKRDHAERWFRHLRELDSAPGIDVR